MRSALGLVELEKSVVECRAKFYRNQLPFLLSSWHRELSSEWSVVEMPQTMRKIMTISINSLHTSPLITLLLKHGTHFQGGRHGSIITMNSRVERGGGHERIDRGLYVSLAKYSVNIRLSTLDEVADNAVLMD